MRIFVNIFEGTRRFVLRVRISRCGVTN